MKIKKSTIVRTILLAVAIINSFLTSRGIGVNLFMNEELAGYISDLFLSITALVAFWYNNSFTKNAIAADRYLADLRGDPEEDDDDIVEEE